MVPFNRGFHDSAKSHFRDSKIIKISPIFARYLETLISRIGRKRIFRLPKCGKFDNTKLGILATWISRQCKTHFQASKIKKISTLSTLKRWFHESAEIEFSGFQNEENSHSKKGILVSRNGRNCFFSSQICVTLGFTTRQKWHFFASEMKKIS